MKKKLYVETSVWNQLEHTDRPEWQETAQQFIATLKVVLTDKFMVSAFNGRHSQRLYNDCSHVAIATINGIKHIVSFNCKRLVNDQRIDGFNAINLQNGYDHIVDICTPEKSNRFSME